MCAQLDKGITIVLDLTWTGWDKLRALADSWGIIYKRGDVSISPYVQAMDDLLFLKNTTDSALIFENEKGTFTMFIFSINFERSLIGI